MTAVSEYRSWERIIIQAMRNATLLGDDGEPNSSQIARYSQRLTDLINFCQTSGLKLWLNQETPIAAPILTAGLSLYRLGPSGNVVMPKPMRVVQGRFVNFDGTQRPLIGISRQEYNTLSQTNQRGALNSYYVDKQQYTLDVYLWQAPDYYTSTGTIYLTTQNQVQGMVQLTDNMNFPDEWFIYLHWALADEICTGQPQAIMDRCEKRAAAYKGALEDWDVEDVPTSFQPDSRMDGWNRSFTR